MPEAAIGERAATLAEATREAAALLRQSRFPVIAGLATDIAGAEAAVALAEASRGAIDHAHSASVLADLGVMREAGWMIVTPREARARADVVLPGAAYTEKDGTYVNHAGLAQTFGRAVRPPTEVRGELQVAFDLLGRRGLARAADVRRELAAAIPGFAGLAAAPPTGTKIELQTV